MGGYQPYVGEGTPPRERRQRPGDAPVLVGDIIKQS
jgi:hypothetical protein